MHNPTLILSAAFTLIAATSVADVALDRHVFGSSGGDQTAGSVRARLTVGQAVIGDVQSTAHEGALGFWGVLGAVTAVGPAGDAGARFALEPPTPNPVFDRVTITYSVDGVLRAPLSLRVFDVRGALVRVLAGGASEPGLHRVSWDGCDASGRPVSAGVYYCELRVGSRSASRRVAVIR